MTIVRAWTPERLRKLRSICRRYPLRTACLSLDVSLSDADLALWALLGRTPEQAASHLNNRAAA